VTAWFVSDIHIKDLNERSSIILLRFLKSILEKQRPATHLFLLGDIFDLWVSNASFFVHKFQALVDAIVAIKKSGVEVVYFEGNHDVHVRHYWEKELQIPTYVDFRIFKLGPYVTRLEHGDLINKEDFKYLKYRKFIRQPYMETLAPFLAGRLLNEVGNVASQLSRKKSSQQREVNQESLRSMIRNYAELAYEELPFDLLITGHMHIQDDYIFEKGEKKVRSINLGSWFEGPKALRLDASGPEFVSLT
jgi:UDP-2,3-diacylglucosamine hydrolase